MKWRQLKFVLPNLFTVSSVFCGFYAITLCSGTATPNDFYTAALAIFFAMFFDGFDGRIARLTRTQSDFGVQLDSLADVMSFGAAPAVLIYWWALEPLGFAGLILAFLFTTCAALRLARFNVLSMRAAKAGPSHYFTGLPTPLAAGMLISVVIALHRQGHPNHTLSWAIAGLVALLAGLMVSNVPYRTFKDVRISGRLLLAFGGVLAVGVAVAVAFRPSLVLVAYFSAYLVLGLGEELLSLVRRSPPEKPLAQGGADDSGEDFL